MAAADVLKKVLQLKSQLKESTDSKTILKSLKRLRELDITLNILADTGIGKTVNAFRKHNDAGDVAKSLVAQWKKLLPKESTSPIQEQSGGEDECHKDRREISENTRFDGKKSEFTSPESECKPVGSHKKSKVPFRSDSRAGSSFLHQKNYPNKDKSKVLSPKSSQPSTVFPNGDSKSKGNCRRGMHEVTNCQETKSSLKDKKSSRVKEASLEPKKPEELSDRRKGQNGKVKKLNVEERKGEKMKMESGSANDSQPSEDEGGKPTMSFESYLSYDLKAPKRKKKPLDGEKPAKKLKVTAAREEPLGKAPGGKDRAERPKSSSEQSPEKTAGGNVMDLLNIPLPTFLPVCEDFTSFPYFEKKSEDEACSVGEEAPIFTGQRLNKKMQVYSGTKSASLPTMMSLYQQCIRTLQNNIDLLYEIGGVPFEILEPVLERCTPEQLLRIEECNPVYIGDTDHLWERHCQKDFRNGALEEYESWREMHLRLSTERERKLRKLTESIVSAYSGKSKGRQVKLAFINSTVKPPRNVRIKQELHGTAGPVMPHKPPDRPRSTHAFDRTSTKSSDSRARPSCSDVTPITGQAPEARKIKRVAPMMAKSLRAFKKQLVRR